MGIMIVLILGLFLGIGLIIRGINKYDDCDELGLDLTSFFAFVILLCSTIIIISQSTANLQCDKLKERKKAIEYRLEQIDANDQNIMINGGIYDDIVEYNNDVRKYKTFRHSFWTNWFVSKGLDEFDYIEYNIDKS